MSISFPGALDSFEDPEAADKLNSPSHSDMHANVHAALEALEAKVGIDNSTDVDSLDYRIELINRKKYPTAPKCLLMGDSNGVGYGITQANGYSQNWILLPTTVHTETGWFHQALIASRGAIRISRNASVSGRTSTQILAALQSAMDSYDSEVVFIAAGTNDPVNGISVETTMTNIETMVDQVLAEARLPVILTCPPHGTQAAGIRAINVRLRIWCAQNKIDLIDAYRAVAAPDGGWQDDMAFADNLHYDVGGAKAVGKLVADWAIEKFGSQVEPYMNVYESDSQDINLLTNATFSEALEEQEFTDDDPPVATPGIMRPPGWYWLGSGQNDSFIELVEPDEVDNWPSPIIGNWVKVSKINAQTSTYLRQKITTGFSEGDRLAFTGRIKVPEEISNASPENAYLLNPWYYEAYLSFVPAGSFIGTLYEWKTPVDGTWYTEGVVPAGTTSIYCFLRFRVNYYDDGVTPNPYDNVYSDAIISGSVYFAQPTVINLTELGLA